MGILNIIATYLEQGSGGILATVVKRTGSAPRDVGAKMFVGEDGKMFGTVGGGRLESDAYQKALEIMGSHNTAVLSVNMDALNIEDTDMLCGGNVELLLEPVIKRHCGVYEAIRKCREDREQAVIFTRFGTDGFAKSLILSDGTVVGDPEDDEVIDRCMDVLRRRTPELSGNTFAEPVKIVVPLYLFGAGHVSQHVSKIAKAAGFFVTVIDDREEFANTERFEDADSVVVGELRDVFYTLDFTGNEYVVILTRSHEYDMLVLEEVLKKNAKYIGMIGSERKVKIITDRLNKKGFDRNVIDSIHAPIGIDIGAETPQEIAVSIVAELIKVKNEK